MRTTTKRTKKLLEPRLQLRLIGEFLGLALLGLVLQYILIGVRLREIASEVDAAPGDLVDAVPQVLTSTLLFTFAILVPLLLAFGTRFTFRLVGPLYRFERYLTELKAGRASEPCTLRSTDELQHLCVLLNEATAPLRAKDQGERAASDALAAEAAPLRRAS